MRGTDPRDQAVFSRLRKLTGAQAVVLKAAKAAAPTVKGPPADRVDRQASAGMGMGMVLNLNPKRKVLGGYDGRCCQKALVMVLQPTVVLGQP